MDIGGHSCLILAIKLVRLVLKNTNIHKIPRMFIKKYS